VHRIDLIAGSPFLLIVVAVYSFSSCLPFFFFLMGKNFTSSPQTVPMLLPINRATLSGSRIIRFSLDGGGVPANTPMPKSARVQRRKCLG